MQSTPETSVSRRGFLASLASAAAVATTLLSPVGLRGESSTVCTKDSCPTKTVVKECIPRTQDEVWLVSTRCLGCPSNEPTPPPMQVWRYDCDANFWNASTLDELLEAQEPSMPTVFWVHGNRIMPGEAQSQGLSVYRQLTRGVSGDKPIRFVIFSWPSSPIHGLREDARAKAARTNYDGHYLGWLVNEIDPKVSVNFIGYSFGSRIVTGALHLLGGGALFGRVLPDPIEKRAPMQAVLIASAVHNNWMAIGWPHGQALIVVDRMLALNNSCDRALKRYGVVDPCNRPQALGYTGAYGPFGENGRKLTQRDMCCWVGKEHNWENYFYNPSIVALIRPYVGLAD
jgi:hypothetical protein